MHRYRIIGPLTLMICGIAAGFFLARASRSNHSSEREVLYYVDPMHPSYRSSRPGTAPDCGMALEPVYAQDAASSAAGPIPSSNDGDVHIDDTMQRLYGIRLALASSGPLTATTTLPGRVAVDSSRIYRINAGTAGYVQRTQNDAVGNLVYRDQCLAEIYSSELIYAVSGFLARNERIPGPSMTDMPQNGNAGSVTARTDYLRSLGLSDAQIAEMHTTHKPPDKICITAPSDAVITSRTVSSGMHFEKDVELYTLADLRHVWILAQLSADQASQLPPGLEVLIEVQGTSEKIRGHVSSGPPMIDPETRAQDVRIEVENPRLILKPDMIVSVEWTSRPRPVLTVPQEAVLDSGLQQRVFVQVTPHTFAARTVRLGQRFGDRIQVLAGLTPGATIVASGAFLVDSESRLHQSSGSAQDRP